MRKDEAKGDSNGADSRLMSLMSGSRPAQCYCSSSEVACSFSLPLELAREIKIRIATEKAPNLKAKVQKKMRSEREISAFHDGMTRYNLDRLFPDSKSA